MRSVTKRLSRHGRIQDVYKRQRLDKTNITHVPVGKASFTDEQLNDNFQSLMGAINKAKPASLKGQYIKLSLIHIYGWT